MYNRMAGMKRAAYDDAALFAHGDD